MKLLLTAFDPFGGEPVNPALEAVKLVSDTVGSVQVVKLEVPTVFGKSIDKVAKAIEAERPDAVLCIGQAGGRFDLTPERVAINLDDARIKDNEGNVKVAEGATMTDEEMLSMDWFVEGVIGSVPKTES